MNPSPLTAKEEAELRELAASWPEVSFDGPRSTAFYSTVRRLLDTLDAARQGDHYHGGHFHAGPCVGGVPGDRFPLNESVTYPAGLLGLATDWEAAAERTMERAMQGDPAAAMSSAGALRSCAAELRDRLAVAGRR